MFLAIFVFLVCIVFLVRKTTTVPANSFFSTLKKVPGPKAIHFFGHRWMFSSWFGPYKLHKLHEAYDDLFKKFGYIFREEFLWNFPIINISDKNDLQIVLKASAKSKYPIRPPNEVTAHYRQSRPDRYTNLGLVNEQGELWHILRSSLTPQLTSGKVMQQFLPELNNASLDFNRLIRHYSDEKNVVSHFEELADRMGLEGACTLILGRRLGSLDEELSPVTSRLVHAVQEQFVASRDAQYGLPFWKILKTPAYRKFIKCEDDIYDIISKMVDEALDDESKRCAVDDSVQSVFMSILNAKNLDLRDKKAAIIDFIAAGIKTFGNTLVFLLYLIAKNPSCQDKIYEEIIDLAPCNEDLTLNIVQSAKYLRACVFEGYRFLPTVPFVARISEESMDLSGYHIPVGTVMLCHTWSACLRNENFPDARTFKPERWLDEDTVSQENSFLVCAFGIGRRMCPGKRFTELELYVCLANIIRDFRVQFVGELDLQFEFLLTPGSRNSFIFEPR